MCRAMDLEEGRREALSDIISGIVAHRDWAIEHRHLSLTRSHLIRKFDHHEQSVLNPHLRMIHNDDALQNK